MSSPYSLKPTITINGRTAVTRAIIPVWATKSLMLSKVLRADRKPASKNKTSDERRRLLASDGLFLMGLRELVKERDDIREQIRGLEEVSSNSALYCPSPSSSTPPPTYLTKTSPTTYALRQPPPSQGILLNCGLDFYVHLTTPSEIRTTAEGRVGVLEGKLKVVEEDVERVRVDTENVIRMIEELGGEMKEK
ncbi:hypothetical protein TrRE_jg10110 [Triparma retinervis]|uniref:Uncharacterized protein n=1 Tax=Triparma retinervis TaxID=2557542 RepID=A0A9W7DW43_9STRA|nr:hypothetical protein TrRE_jg10110 [Triparma retinervis]